MHSMRQVHRLGVTWELLLDPATFLFFIGGLTMLAFGHVTKCPPAAVRRLVAGGAGLGPESVGLAAGAGGADDGPLFAAQCCDSDPDRALHAMNHFFSPWVLLLLLAVPVLLAWRFVRMPVPLEDEAIGLPTPSGSGSEDEGGEQSSEALTLTLSRRERGARRILSSPFLFDRAGRCPVHRGDLLGPGRRPAGRPRDGRRTPFHLGTHHTGLRYNFLWRELGYNYAAIYNYLGQYYQMSRLQENDKIDDQTLSKCDVLIIKIPTARYSQTEAEAVARFVERGGGLLLIGDHTNFERSATAMNDITRRMGFIFRDDLLFGFGESPYDERYVPPALSHPAVQHLPPLDFAVSCSIDPGSSHGRAVVVNTGLWSMGPEYHHDNFHPIPQHCPEMHYGPFVQAWAARQGQGRAIAFTDSTIFSSFCVFQPAKAEIMLGMVEWLNHANLPLDPRLWLLVLGLPPLVVGLWMVRGRMERWPVLLAAGVLRLGRGVGCDWRRESLDPAHARGRPPAAPRGDRSHRVGRTAGPRNVSRRGRPRLWHAGSVDRPTRLLYHAKRGAGGLFR